MSTHLVEEVTDFIPLRNVVMSLSEKEGLEALCKGLIQTCPGVNIYSSSGTYKALQGYLPGYPNLIEVSAYTGQPELAGGLVKTLHHKLFLGYLAEQDSVDHQGALAREGAVMIDAFFGNLYPFAKTIKSGNVTIEFARSQIDVGGPSALRAAAKNFLRVLSMTDPNDYAALLEHLNKNGGRVSLKRRFEGSQKTFRHLADYDNVIANYLANASFEDVAAAYKIN